MASDFAQLLYDFIAGTSGQITQQQQAFVIGADCLFESLDGDAGRFRSAPEWPALDVRCAGSAILSIYRTRVQIIPSFSAFDSFFIQRFEQPPVLKHTLTEVNSQKLKIPHGPTKPLIFHYLNSSLQKTVF